MDKKDIENEDDISLEADEENTLSGGGSPAEKILKVKAELKKCFAEKEEYLSGWQRERADFANFKKGLAEEKQKMIQFSREEVLFDILPVLDSFDMARGNGAAWEAIDKNWREGVEHIFNQLRSVLSGYDVQVFHAEGEKFDPARHHSQEEVSVVDESEDGKVIEVLQKGYMSKNSVLRPALVKVGRFKKEKN